MVLRKLDLLAGDAEGATACQCPFVNRRVIRWPPEPAATAAKYVLRGYLQAEDAFHERTHALAPGRHRSVEICGRSHDQRVGR